MGVYKDYGQRIGECFCDWVDIGVGMQMVRPDLDCPIPEHRQYAEDYAYGLEGP